MQNADFVIMNFKLQKKHAWYYKARVTNFNKHENLQNDALTTANSVITFDGNEN